MVEWFWFDYKLSDTLCYEILSQRRFEIVCFIFLQYDLRAEIQF